MADTKMEKVTLISDKKNQGQILQVVQGMHAVEIRDLFQESENNEWVEKYFPETATIDKESKAAVLTSELSEIRTAIQFIEHHGEKGQKKRPSRIISERSLFH